MRNRVPNALPAKESKEIGVEAVEVWSFPSAFAIITWDGTGVILPHIGAKPPIPRPVVTFLRARQRKITRRTSRSIGRRTPGHE